MQESTAPKVTIFTRKKLFGESDIDAIRAGKAFCEKHGFQIADVQELPESGNHNVNQLSLEEGSLIVDHTSDGRYVLSLVILSDE